MSTSSFPYLRFARLHGLDYGTVLRAADYMLASHRVIGNANWDRTKHFVTDLNSLSMGNAAALQHVCAHEHDRRKAAADEPRG